jgi:hypothetical protein
METNTITAPTLQFGSIKVPPIAHKTNMIMARRSKKVVTNQKAQWSSGVGYGWVEDFIQCGLKPFLESYGYSIGYSDSKASEYCRAWAFSHVQAKKVSPSATVKCLKSFHGGGEAELDWFLFHISHDEWSQLCYEWRSSEFLDDSDAGFAQQSDLPFFAWNLLNLAYSRAHGKFMQAMSDEYPDEEDFGGFHATDDSGAFGGDRRTL